MAKQKEYAIRCYIDGKRKLTHLLNRRQAMIFKRTALHLTKYLTKSYKV